MRQLVVVMGLSVASAAAWGCAPGGGSEDLGALGRAVRVDDSSTEFTDCTEQIGFTSAPLANVEALVSPELTLVDDGAGRAVIIVRTFACAGASTDGAAPRPGVVAHIGASIAPPSGGEDLNFAMLWMATDLPLLAARLRATGVPVQHVLGLSYEVTDDGEGAAIAVTVPLPADPAYTMTGPITNPAPDTPPVALVANWYWVGPHAAVVMRSEFPGVQFGGGDTAVDTAPGSPLAALLGVATTDFDVNYRGVFATTVTDVFATPR